LFTLYDEDEMDDLTPRERAVLKERVKGELNMRHKR
jgi:FixJ family two-component response regulator